MKSIQSYANGLMTFSLLVTNDAAARGVKNAQIMTCGGFKYVGYLFSTTADINTEQGVA